MISKKKTALKQLVVSVLLLRAICDAPASAAQFKLGEADVILNGALTAGIAWRASDRDPDLLPGPNATAIGVVGRAPAGQNADDGNLNFGRGDPVSSVLKAVANVEIRHGAFGLHAGLKAWKDLVLGERDVPWGHLPNGYVANAPLSDSAFNRYTEFSSVVLTNAYASVRTTLAERPLEMKLGRQTIRWGVPTSIRGGLEQINAYDIPAMVRPGAVAEEYAVPALAAFAKFNVAKGLDLEGFYQFRFEPNQIPACGTFNSHADYAAAGCDRVLVGPLNDRAALAAGLFARRAPDVYASDDGQFGAGLSYLLPGVGRLGLYYANIHSRRWVPSSIKSTRPTPLPPLIPGDPGGANVQYFVEYPENVRLFALTFLTQLPDKTVLFAELAHQPNQPVRLSGTDLLNAFASNALLTPLRAEATATAPGGRFHGYDRLRTTQLNIGGRKPFGRVAGIGDLTLDGEVGVKLVHDLPDPSIRRYGRGDPFGAGPVNGVCAGPPVQCSNAGYVTSAAWGYRVRASLEIPQVLPGVNVKPSLALAHDVKGWAYDDEFSEKRKRLLASIRAEYRKNYFAELQWIAIWGGTYDLSRDRDVVMLSGGVTF